MSKAELDRLEREAEQARARLIGGLRKLRTNDQFSQVTQRVRSDLVQGKGGLIGQAKSAARHRADSVLDEIKARVAANPGAALAIGAGLAWRLYRHPPIATMLVGAGLMALMRTDPARPAMGAETAARAMDLAGSARDRVQEWRAADPSGQASDQGNGAKERIGELAENAKEQIGTLAESTRERMIDARTAASRRLRQAGRAADRWTESGRRAVSEAMQDAPDRDKYLLGAAALALAAAIGIAAQRRLD